MSPLQGVIALKVLLDGFASLGWLVMKDPAQALMFMGFAVADLACFVMAIR